MKYWNQKILSVALGALLVLGIGCEQEVVVPERPQAPSIMRDVSRINDNIEFNEPFIPGNRTTMDGRVALVVEGQEATAEAPLIPNFDFYLFAPEKLKDPVMTGPAGAQILANEEPLYIDVPSEITNGFTGVKFNMHHTLCDATEEFAGVNERPNPYSCGPDGKNDCYDITIITAVQELLVTQIWGTPTTVVVTDPKTARAAIADISLGEPVLGKSLIASQNLNEPAVTSDGRLLTGRRGALPYLWQNPSTGLPEQHSHDLVYSVLPEDSKACDVTGWKKFHPISHAAYDPEMKGKYGLAAYPLRDTEGNPIPDGEDVGGSYPWVDREGANVFMSGVHGHLPSVDPERYPRRCAQSGVDCESLAVTHDYTRGVLVSGLWTHGKFVLLDSMINHTDWAVGVAPSSHYMVDLYKDPAGGDVSVRVGGGRFVQDLRSRNDVYPVGYTENANVVDSIQNVFNYNQSMRTVTPRDVVWLMSSGVATDEVVFDDYLNPNAFIVSSMQASITRNPRDLVGFVAPYYHDGHTRDVSLGLASYLLTGVYTEDYEDIHIQNAATSLGWQVPAYGLVEKNTGRIEPVAMGGIKGKGFWLSGRNSIKYDVPSQKKDISNHPWFISLFLDARPAEVSSELTTLITFPDNTQVQLVTNIDETYSVKYLDDARVIADILMPVSDGWRHLAWQVAPGAKKVTMFVDGFAYDTRELQDPIFELSTGTLSLGATNDRGIGFRGWIDDFKVLAERPNLEVVCNHARGTLIAVDNNASWETVAAKYPEWAHQSVQTATYGAAGSAQNLACFTDYSGDYQAHLFSIPDGTRSMREAINFPEGPLKFGQPRPDSSDNGFCLSCHTPKSKGGLSIDALTYQPINLEDDRRRQPSQPPRRVFGNIPAHWIVPGSGPGSPEFHSIAPMEGALMDRWILFQ